jgi:uncharacterized Zn finger protein
MLRFHELEQNPVTITCADESGATFDVITLRLREGVVKMTCRCEHYSQEGWCKHCLAVFTNKAIYADTGHREAFNRLVGGTYLQEAAAKLINALEVFATSYKQMKSLRPSQISSAQLKQFATQAGRAASSADDLAEALKGFINEAAARRGPDDRPPLPVNSVLSEDKRGALDKVRRALGKGVK